MSRYLILFLIACVPDNLIWMELAMSVTINSTFDPDDAYISDFELGEKCVDMRLGRRDEYTEYVLHGGPWYVTECGMWPNE